MDLKIKIPRIFALICIQKYIMSPLIIVTFPRFQKKCDSLSKCAYLGDCDYFGNQRISENTGYLFFRNPSRTQIVTFSLGQNDCDYLAKCYYYEWGQ